MGYVICDWQSLKHAGWAYRSRPFAGLQSNLKYSCFTVVCCLFLHILLPCEKKNVNMDFSAWHPGKIPRD